MKTEYKQKKKQSKVGQRAGNRSNFAGSTETIADNIDRRIILVAIEIKYKGGEILDDSLTSVFLRRVAFLEEKRLF